MHRARSSLQRKVNAHEGPPRNAHRRRARRQAVRTQGWRKKNNACPALKPAWDLGLIGWIAVVWSTSNHAPRPV